MLVKKQKRNMLELSFERRQRLLRLWKMLSCTVFVNVVTFVILLYPQLCGQYSMYPLEALLV